MKRLFALLLLAGVTACAAATSEFAFGRADSSDDDMVSRSEFAEFVDDVDAFVAYDDNDDGSLSRVEYREAADDDVEGDAYFDGFDRDGNDALSRDEYLTGWFNLFDTDDDSMLDEDEFDNAVGNMAVEIT